MTASHWQLTRKYPSIPSLELFSFFFLLGRPISIFIGLAYSILAARLYHVISVVNEQ